MLWIGVKCYMQIVEKSLFFIFLCIMVICDIKKGLLPFRFIIIELFIIIAFVVFGNYLSLYSRIFGGAQGLILLLVSKLTKESIGYGDSIIFCFSGFTIGGSLNLYLVLYSSLFGAIYATVLIVRKKLKRKDRVIFTPCILLSYIGVLLL